MAKKPTETSNRLQHRNLPAEDEEVNDMEGTSSTSLETTDVDAASTLHDPLIVPSPRASSNPTAEQLHTHRSSLTASHWRTVLHDPPRRSDVTLSMRDTSGVGSSDLRLEPAESGAPNIEMSSQDQAQDTQTVESRTSQDHSDAVWPARRVCASSSSRRSPSPLQTTSSPGSTLESMEAGHTGDPYDPSLPCPGDVELNAAASRHTTSHEVETRLHQVSLPLAVLPDLDPCPWPPYMPSFVHHRQDVSFPNEFEFGFSDTDEDLEELYSRSRKRRHGLAFPAYNPTSPRSKKFKQNLLSKVSKMHGRASPGPLGTQSYQNPIIARHTGTQFRGFDFDMATQIQNNWNVCHEPASGRELHQLGCNKTILEMATRRGLENSPSYYISYLPPALPLGNENLFYLSECFPRSFDSEKRSTLLSIFRTRASYVPSCISLATGLPGGIRYHVCNPSTPSKRWHRLPLGPKGRGWPSNSLPLEVFQIIAEFLSRDSLQNMRFVNHEFENKISNILFNTVVVPFRPEIYGMMIQNSSPPNTTVVDIKGKRKQSSNESSKTLHDGMRTFQGWGPHIKKFAMAFEVEESTLEQPLVKGKFETHPTFWGQYKWPHPYYSRFEFCEGLEKKADEFRCMSAALSNLTGVKELGLSIDCGLGWLNGPDVSDSAQLFREKPGIFGEQQRFSNAASQERQEIWDTFIKAIRQSQTQPDFLIQDDLYEVDVEWEPNMSSSLPVRPTFRGPLPALPCRPLIFGGVDVRSADGPSPLSVQPTKPKSSTFSTAALVPNGLSPSQKEWLLETEWAQRAFMSSFCMALCDNSQIFGTVTTLTIARLSSRFLPSLQRWDIWLALENLSSLVINVSADWRDISKSESGLVEAPCIKPSTAAAQFFKLLRDYVSRFQKIRKLGIGYVGGGEHQVGLHGRNKHILPAPVADLSDLANLHSATALIEGILSLPRVEDLTLTNCWFTPRMFLTLCQRARTHGRLKKLTLESVSLTSRPGRPGHLPEREGPRRGLENCIGPQGPPRYGDRSVGNFFDLRPDDARDPLPSEWPTTLQRLGSWGRMIDMVTPGATLDFVLYAYQYYDKDHFDSLPRSDRGSLESITFESCGYVRLTHFQEFHQAAVGPVDEVETNPGLAERASELRSVMMEAEDDKLLGQIVPAFPTKEKDVLETGFPMRFGWTDKAKAERNLDDGQPPGGSGRFSGKVERLTFPDED